MGWEAPSSGPLSGLLSTNGPNHSPLCHLPFHSSYKTANSLKGGDYDFPCYIANSFRVSTVVDSSFVSLAQDSSVENAP